MGFRERTTEILDSPRWAEVAEQTKDIVTPANLFTLGGLALTIKGSGRLGTLRGTGEILSGRLLDLADGWIARRTNTATELGATADATADKIATGALLWGAMKNNLMPKPAAYFIASQNAANAAAAVVGRYRGVEMESSRGGKINTALQSAALIGYPAATLIEKWGYPDEARVVRIASTALVGSSVLLSAKVTPDYIREALGEPSNLASEQPA